jgi:ribosomal protein S18 acetylase RimI-like enzyme
MLQIRLATAPDCDAIGALISQMAAHYGGPAANVEVNAAAAMARTAIASQEGTRFLLAWHGSMAVGIACFVVIRPGRNLKGLIYLKDLFVPEDRRGLGIGRQLMAALAGYAGQHDIGRIDLRTNTSNTGAQRLYESLGGIRDDKINYSFDPAKLKAVIQA